MTPDQRLDRLERIAILLANSGRRARRELRHDLWNHDHKISYLADLQIKNEERFAKLAESPAHLDEAQARLDESHAKLAESQAGTNQRLDALIEIIKNRNGGSSTNN